KNVLPPGTYRINKYAYDVKLEPATELKSGFVGVQRRLLGTASNSVFAEHEGQQGYLTTILQPGLYYMNPKEIQVIPIDVGIFQTSYHAAGKGKDKPANRPIVFTCKGGFEISLDCTVEWEIAP